MSSVSQDIWAKLIFTKYIEIKSLWKELEVMYEQNANFKLHATLIVRIVERREYKRRKYIVTNCLFRDFSETMWLCSFSVSSTVSVYIC